MDRGIRRLVVAAVATFVACPASALAAQRFATPSGSGTACTATAPCSIVMAINSAAANDEVIVAGNQGAYGSPESPISTGLSASGVSIHGATGQPRPVIYSSAGLALDVVNESAVSDLAIYETATNAEAIQAGGSTVDHLLAVASTSNGTGCSGFGGSTFTDSLCVGGSYGGQFGSSGSGTCTLTETVRNDTFIGGTTGFYFLAIHCTDTAAVTNTIMRGASKDIVTDESSGTAKVTADHSNYATVDTSLGGTVTPAGSGSNQTAAPQFVNAAADDFHEASGSPTVDAGLNNAANGSTDLDGNPRTFGASTDIGAYEYIPPPTCQPASASTPYGQPVAIQLSCSDSVGAPVSYQVVSGPAHGTVSVNPSTGAATYTPAAGYSGSDSFSFDASSSHGTSQATTASITVGPPPVAVVVPTISGLKLSPHKLAIAGRRLHDKCVKATRKNRRHRACTRPVKLTITFKLNTSATLTLTLKREVTGRKVHGRCVKSTKKNARHKHCTLLPSVPGRIVHPSGAGANKIVFAGRIGKKRIGPGVYQLILSPAGGKPEAVTFTITG